MVNIDETFEAAYLTVTGQLVKPPHWAEAAAGSSDPYEQAWQEWDDAKAHLCARFGMDWEDPDLERLTAAAERIQRDVAKRMFLCGRESGRVE